MRGFRIGVWGALLAVNVAGTAAPPGPFALRDYEDYRREELPIAARDGAELVRRFCSAPPPGCEPDTIACSIHPEFPGAEWRYRFSVIRVRAPRRARGAILYDVRSVALEPATAGAYVFHPEKAGRVVLWRSLSAERHERALVWDYLVKRSGRQEALIRLDDLDRMAEEIAWHERQHVLAGIAFNRELERIMNTPGGYPRRLALRPGQRPEPVLLALVARDRERRITDLLRRNARCAAEFHAWENRPDSFSSLVGQCACFGGWACAAELPPFPRGDFRCHEAPVAFAGGAKRGGSGAFEAVHQLEKADHAEKDTAGQ